MRSATSGIARPVAIFQHDRDVGPGYFETWLRERELPYALIRIDRGEPVPADPREFSGLCFMGGPMSVNDPLPWIEPACALIRAADAAGVPVIGHCLGGQLLAKALGVPVTRSAVKEIGWGALRVTDAQLAAAWLGVESLAGVEFFQWHGDAFELPPGARNFLASEFCEYQAYVIDRGGYAHLGMQFHCEMTPALVNSWVADESWIVEIEEERRATGGPAVQDAAEMLRDVHARTTRMNALAARLYDRWSRGLATAPRRRPLSGAR
ncbi:type 1 glutamine amidotransferase [Betaproteobacteria bacterium PRO7]|jgi:GMP synthase-like glutamine amidotransferase|nr:type 1 glutamine amidotransferase [Betaproteobacteria bacterium PRO7]